MRNLLRIISTKNIASFLFALIAIMTISALAHSDTTLNWGWLNHDILVRIEYIVFTLLVLSLLPHLNIKEIRINSLLAMISVFSMLFMNIISPNEAGLGVLTAPLCILFCISPKDIQRRSFEIFRSFWVMACLVGIFCYLCYILNVPIPFEETPYYFSSYKLHYINYGISYLYDNGSLLRLCGICNEPGYFGTFCALILCAEGFHFKRMSNIVILVAGLLTLSAAFMMIIVIYLIVKMIISAYRNKVALQKILTYFGVFIIIFSYLVVLPNIVTGNRAVDTVLQRITLTSEGVSGDDRTTEEFDELYDSTPFSDLVFGKGRGYLAINGYSGNLSYKVSILEYGIIGCIIMWGTLFAAAIYKNTKNTVVIIFAIVFFASIYQRPHIITLPYFILLLGGIEYIKYVICTEPKDDEDEKEKLKIVKESQYSESIE